jgi:fatty-acid peroxygenase
VSLDLALRLWRQGYDAIPSTRGWPAGRDAFVTRMLGRRALVVRGERGARLLYDTGLVRRRKAVPAALAGLLFGRGAVHGLDGRQHAERKSLMMRVLDPDRVDELVSEAGVALDGAIETWQQSGEVVMFDELVRTYGAAVLSWAGTGLSGPEADHTSHELARIVDGFGGAGRAYPRAWLARRSTDALLRSVIDDARTGRTDPPEGSPVRLLAESSLPLERAAVELGNVLRPTVAVAWLGTFAALALSENPSWAPRLASDGAAREAFAHEVRRFFPFVPALAGRLTGDYVGPGARLRRGDRVVLDVPGTNYDPRTFDRPELFAPERFLEQMPGPFAFVPQGGGHPETGHRCPGERAAMGLLTETLRVLSGVELTTRSDVHVDARRIPTLPTDGLVVRVRSRS